MVLPDSWSCLLLSTMTEKFGGHVPFLIKDLAISVASFPLLAMFNGPTSATQIRQSLHRVLLGPFVLGRINLRHLTLEGEGRRVTVPSVIASFPRFDLLISCP